MTKIRNKKVILLFLFMTVIIITQSITTDIIVLERSLDEHESYKVSAYTDHSPILIDGNADFLSQASLEGWPGDGTPGNPVNISNYRISQTSVDCIKMCNVDIHWRISNCLFEGGDPYASGLYFINASNGRFENNIIRDRDIAIQAYEGMANCHFIDNQIYDNQDNALKVIGGMIDCTFSGNVIYNNLGNNLWMTGGFTSCEIKDNVITGGNNGIRILACNGTIIQNNVINGSQLDCIVVPSAVDTSIIDNTVINPVGMGIMVSGDFLNIESNTVTNGTSIGIYLATGDNCTISRNHVANCSDYGISLSRTTAYNTVSENVLINNNAEDCQVKDDGDGDLIIYNHYNDWITPDENSDNIVDVPYSLDGEAANDDPYPLVDPEAGIPITTTTNTTTSITNTTATTTTSNTGTMGLFPYAAVGLMIVIIAIAVILRKRR